MESPIHIFLLIALDLIFFIRWILQQPLFDHHVMVFINKNILPSMMRELHTANKLILLLLT